MSTSNYIFLQEHQKIETYASPLLTTHHHEKPLRQPLGEIHAGKNQFWGGSNFLNNGVAQVSMIESHKDLGKKQGSYEEEKQNYSNQDKENMGILGNKIQSVPVVSKNRYTE